MADSDDPELDSSAELPPRDDPFPAESEDAGKAPAPPEGKPQAPGKGSGSFLEVALVVLLALFLALLLKVYVAEAYEIKGRSMERTFHEQERVMVLKVFYEIRRGDVVIFSSSENPEKDLIKRVIGLPGDVIEVNDGEVSVNGEKLDEHRYAITRNHRPQVVKDRVPPGKYYVLGDNRPDSMDSRQFHAIDASSIKGKVVLRWWPLDRLKMSDF